MKLCACGLPLHYSNPKNQRYVERMIEDLGETVTVRCLGAGSWEVPRHFIALHGLKATELPELASRYGFEKVSGDE